MKKKKLMMTQFRKLFQAILPQPEAFKNGEKNKTFPEKIVEQLEEKKVLK